MASAQEIREWGREQGYEVPEKGNLPGWLKDRYGEAHGQTGPAAYPPGMGDADFELTAEAAIPDANGHASADDDDTGEDRPGPPASTARPPKSAGSLRDRIASAVPRAKPAAKPKRTAKTKPRVPVDELIGGAWRMLSRVARPVPPLQRTLRVQAPVAGLLLEDVVKDTALDRALQPIARGLAGGKVVAALVGPPMTVTAITLHLQTAAAQGQAPNPIVMSTLTEMLRESLMIWIDVAGPKFEQALAREREFEQRYGQDVDNFIAFLFAPPVDESDPDAVRAEEDAIRHAQRPAA